MWGLGGDRLDNRSRGRGGKRLEDGLGRAESGRGEGRLGPHLGEWMVRRAWSGWDLGNAGKGGTEITGEDSGVV